MERYNVLLSDEESSKGLIIIPSSKYAALVDKRPEFTHENFGDFYSREPMQDIVRAMFMKVPSSVRSMIKFDFIDKAIAGERDMSQKAVYFIQGKNGGRIFIKGDCEDVCANCRGKYEAILLASVCSVADLSLKGKICESIEKRNESVLELNRILDSIKEISLEMRLMLLRAG